MEELTYQQVLADIYDENAKSTLVFQTEYNEEEIPPDDKHPDELENQEEFQKFDGPRGKPENVIKPTPVEEGVGKSSIKRDTDVRNIVISVDGSFRDNILQPVTLFPRTTPFPSLVSQQITSSNFTFFTSKIYRNITSVKLTSLEIPNTFYTFSTTRGNTTFVINTSGAYTGSFNITIPNGNYMQSGPSALLSAQVLTDKIQAAINAAVSPSGQHTLQAYNFKCNYDSSTHQVSFNGDLPFTITFPSSNSNPYKNGIGYNLGFVGKSYSSFPVFVDIFGNPIASSITQYIYADMPPDVVQDRYIYLQINDWNLVEHQESGQTHFSVFARIQLPVAKNVLVFDNNYINSSTKEYFFQQPVDIQRLDISALDAYGEVLDLQNQNISMTLEFKQVNDSSVYEKLLEL